MKKSNPFFSIIICTLNEEQVIDAFLRSVYKQEYKEFEVIVVDGHSDDLTQTIVKKWIPRFNNTNVVLRLISSKYRNLSYQRNTGVSKARGKFVLIIDPDGSIQSDYLLQLHQKLENMRNSIILIRFIPDQKGIFPFLSCKLLSLLSWCTARGFIVRLWGAHMILSADVFKKMSGFDTRLHHSEDHEFARRAKRAGVAFTFFPSIAVTLSFRRLRKMGMLSFIWFYFAVVLDDIRMRHTLKTSYQYPMGGTYYK